MKMKEQIMTDQILRMKWAWEEVKEQKMILILTRNEGANDEGTNALMSDYISEQEKLVWMYTAYQGWP